MTDKLHKERQYVKGMMVVANRMQKAAGIDHPRDIFFAAALLMAWTLSAQNEETRADAIDMALDMFKSGMGVFGNDRSLNS